MNDWMSTDKADRMLEEATTQLHQQHRKLENLGAMWKEQAVVRSKDNTLTATFDGRGELLDLAFRGERYRTLPPAQLAASIVETIQRGRQESADRVNEIMGGPGAGDLTDATAFDPVAMLNDVMAPMMKTLDQFGLGGAANAAANGGTPTDGDATTRDTKTKDTAANGTQASERDSRD